MHDKVDLVIKSVPLKKQSYSENDKERQDIFSTFSFYHRAAVKQEHYMKTFQKKFGDAAVAESTILWQHLQTWPVLL
jgi:hypothetical protein